MDPSVLDGKQSCDKTNNATDKNDIVEDNVGSKKAVDAKVFILDKGQVGIVKSVRLVVFLIVIVVVEVARCG